MNLRKIIREEMDNMWQNLFQGEGNIWFSYEMVVFDEMPTKEEVIKLIRDAFKSGLVRQEAIDSWENEGIENEVRIITSKLRETPYLRIDLKDGWLYYGSYYEEVIKLYPELRVIKYSEAKNYLVNESEEDDLKWIIDIEPQNYQWSATQNLINQTEIIPNAFMGEPMIKVPFTNLQFNKPKHFSNVHTFKDYIKSNYGIEDPLTITNIFNTWSAEINKKLKNLNESEEINDFTWVTDEPINPWLQYSMIIFDEEPTREEINNYIELALNTGRISNKEAWEIGREQDIDGILEYIRQDGGAVLKIDQWGDLQYADISYYNSSHNAIRYSQLANKNLNESEDDWDWARGPVFTNEFNIGDRIRVYNTGSESAFIEWLGMYGQPYLNGEYGKHIEGVVTDVGYDGFLTLAVDSSQINFPTDGHRDDISSVDRSLNGLSISYEQII